MGEGHSHCLWFWIARLCQSLVEWIRMLIMPSPIPVHWWISSVSKQFTSQVKCKKKEKDNREKGLVSLFRIVVLTGKEGGGDEWFDFSSVILGEASDPPEYDKLPTDREELVLDVLSSSSTSTSLFPFKLSLRISELELLCEYTSL